MPLNNIENKENYNENIKDKICFLIKNISNNIYNIIGDTDLYNDIDYSKAYYIVENLENLKDIDHKKLVKTLMSIGHFDLFIQNLKKFIGLDHKNIVFWMIEKDLLKYLVPNINKFDQINDHSEIVELLLENRDGWIIAQNIDKFHGIDHAKIANIFIKKNEERFVLQFFEKFIGLDKKDFFEKLANKGEGGLIIKYLDYFKDISDTQKVEILIKNWQCRIVAENVYKFTGVDHNFIVDLLLKAKTGIYIGENIEKFIGINHIEVANKLISEGMRWLVAQKLEYFIGIDSDEIAKKLIKNNDLENILVNIEKFENLNPKLKDFFKKLKNSKSNMGLLTRYREINDIDNLEEIFYYFLNNKQKGLIPFLQKYFINKDIGLGIDFSIFSEMLDITNLSNMPIDKQKDFLFKRLDKLLTITKNPLKEKILKNFGNYLTHKKDFESNEIFTQLGKYFDKAIFDYIDVVFYRKLKLKIIKDLNLEKDTSINIKEILENQDFIEAFKMYKNTKINKNEFKIILDNFLSKNPKKDFEFIASNKNWIKKMEKKSINIEGFLKENQESYEIKENQEQIDHQKDINHFIKQSNNNLNILGIGEKFDNAGKIIYFFDKILNKDKENYFKKSNLSKNQFDNIFFDLSLQIYSIKVLLQSKKSKKITNITISQEKDPLKALMMGNYVDGSCLNFYNINGSYWSTSINTIDINKQVFYIKDQNMEIIGRVLTAIDDNGNILRFKLYKKGNIQINLDYYFNDYIKKLANKYGIGLNGDIMNVSLLNGEEWYRDTIKTIS